MTYDIFSADKLGQINPQSGIILDVRTGMEHAEKRLTFAHAHVPLDELRPTDFMMRHGLDKDSDVYIVCRSGKRAAQAAEKFVAEGYRKVHVVEGGIVACENCGYPVHGTGTKSAAGNSGAKGSFSLERQVRIAAGAFAATGSLLGLMVHPLFTIIPLFVGGGLIFAGITDRCGMALILTKAPWNKMNPTSCCGISAATPGPAGVNTGQSCQ